TTNRLPGAPPPATATGDVSTLSGSPRRAGRTGRGRRRPTPTGSATPGRLRRAHWSLQQAFSERTAELEQPAIERDRDGVRQCARFQLVTGAHLVRPHGLLRHEGGGRRGEQPGALTQVVPVRGQLETGTFVRAQLDDFRRGRGERDHACRA